MSGKHALPYVSKGAESLAEHLALMALPDASTRSVSRHLAAQFDTITRGRHAHPLTHNLQAGVQWARTIFPPPERTGPMCDPMTWLDPREGTTTDATHAYLRNLIGAHPVGPVPTHVHYPPAASWADPARRERERAAFRDLMVLTADELD